MAFKQTRRRRSAKTNGVLEAIDAVGETPVPVDDVARAFGLSPQTLLSIRNGANTGPGHIRTRTVNGVVMIYRAAE